MSIRPGLTRCAGLLAVALPLSGLAVVASAPAALASTGITSPGSEEVFSSGTSVKVAASLDGASLSSRSATLSLAGPDYSGSTGITAPAGSTRSGSISAAVGGTHPNGTWKVTFSVSGGSTQTRSFYTSFAPATPTGFTAKGSGSRDVTLTWDRGTEVDLTGYTVSGDFGDPVTLDAASACGGSTCSYLLSYPSDSPGDHSFSLVSRRKSGKYATDGSTVASPDAATAGATLVAPPSPTPQPSGSPASGGGGSTGGTTGGSGTTSGGSTGASTGGSTSGGSTGSTGGTTTKPAAKPTLPTLADSAAAQRRAFALTFKAFAPSLNIPKLPPLPATSALGLQPLPLGTYKPTLPYAPQTETEKTTSVISQPLAAVRSLDPAQLARSIAMALLLLLVAAHVRRYLGAHTED